MNNNKELFIYKDKNEVVIFEPRPLCLSFSYYYIDIPQTFKLNAYWHVLKL